MNIHQGANDHVNKLLESESREKVGDQNADHCDIIKKECRILFGKNNQPMPITHDVCKYLDDFNREDNGYFKEVSIEDKKMAYEGDILIVKRGYRIEKKVEKEYESALKPIRSYILGVIKNEEKQWNETDLMSIMERNLKTKTLSWAEFEKEVKDVIKGGVIKSESGIRHLLTTIEKLLPKQLAQHLEEVLLKQSRESGLNRILRDIEQRDRIEDLFVYMHIIADKICGTSKIISTDFKFVVLFISLLAEWRSRSKYKPTGGEIWGVDKLLRDDVVKSLKECLKVK